MNAYVTHYHTWHTALDTQMWLSHVGSVCEGGQRERARHKERQRWERGEKRGRAGREKRIVLRVCHLHTLDIRIRDKRRRRVFKVKTEMNAFKAAPIQCEQSCVIFAFNSTGCKRIKQPLRESLNPTEKHYFEMWMGWWEGWAWWWRGCITHCRPQSQFKTTQCQPLHLNFRLCQKRNK